MVSIDQLASDVSACQSTLAIFTSHKDSWSHLCSVLSGSGTFDLLDLRHSIFNHSATLASFSGLSNLI